MAKANPLAVARVRRKMRIRKKVFGTKERPRLSVFRSSSHIYAQVIDDTEGRTLVAASTQVDAGDVSGHKGNITAAKAVGGAVARKAIAANIRQVVFDRNGFLYHGRVKALAEAAREAGLEF